MPWILYFIMVCEGKSTTLSMSWINRDKTKNNLDFSINRFFFTSVNEVFYHDIRLQPLIYQDDLGKSSSCRKDAQAGNDKIEACMETKLLDLHQDKSCYIVIGNKKVTGDTIEALELCLLTL